MTSADKTCYAASNGRERGGCLRRVVRFAMKIQLLDDPRCMVSG